MKNNIFGSSSCALVLGLSLAFATFPSTSPAANFNIANGATAALIAAINTANSNGQDDVINLAPNSTYSLTSANNATDGANGLPVITSDGGHTLVINGNNAVISRSTGGGIPNFRILNVGTGKVVISAVRFFNGRVLGNSFAGNNSGGAIFNRGTLTLRNCTIGTNFAVSSASTQSGGGGIFNLSGTVTLTNCLVAENSATGMDALIGGEGGGIYNNMGTVTITSSTLIHNSATRNNTSGAGSGGNGGGLVNTAGTVTLRNCTFDSNGSSLIGGGIVNFGVAGNGTMTVTNCSFSENSTGGGGGAIFNQSAALTLVNSTLSANAVPTSGGGLYNAGASPRLQNTIIAGNFATIPPTTSADVYSPSDAVTSLGHNLIGIIDSSSGWIASDLTGTNAAPRDAMLDALADNGGPTQTMALQTGSPAINAGDNAVLDAPFYVNSDQRFFARKMDTAVDIGAFESGAIFAAKDFNGDRFTDYVLVNSSNRMTAIWNLQGSAFSASRFGPTLPAGWTVPCIGDFNADGEKDYVLFNAGTKQTAVWFLRNTVLASSAFGPTLPPGWALIAAADVNRDGNPDFVLFNASTRQTSIWYLNGTVLNNGVYGPTLPSGYELADALDFNSNGKPDFLLFKPGTRQTAIWYLNGAALSTSAFGPTLPPGWTLPGAADFNGDEKPDYVLYEASTRRTAHWFLNGAALSGSAFGPTLPAGYSLASP